MLESYSIRFGDWLISVELCGLLEVYLVLGEAGGFSVKYLEYHS